MGMAASQARFLGLTARKSNVEYQGQQINQQRTALANESANLYQQMMDLEVPTPPSSSDYKTTTYTLEDSANNNNSDYQIVNLKNGNDGGFTVTLSTDVKYGQSMSQTPYMSSVIAKDANNKELASGYTLDQVVSASITLKDGNYSSASLAYNKNDINPYKVGEDGTRTYDNITKYQIYKVPADEANKITGYQTCEKDLKADGATEFYFYQDEDGNNHFFSAETLNKMLSGNSLNETCAIYFENIYTKEERLDVKAQVEKSSSGRISSIAISDNNENCPSHLRGKTFSVNTEVKNDDTAYDDAMKDYEYKKGLYEQAVSNINAQTEIIQKDDQQLELRLQQLNTEQDAISTEMDSVSKVIEDNVEKTFKTFA